MKKVIMFLAILGCLFLSGCGNLSPRDNFSPKENFNPKLEQDINNQQGRIDRIENNQNAIRTDIERLALINRENNNSGVQILQGDGGLLLVFGLGTVFLILFYFHNVAEGYKKTAEILADQIAQHNDALLEEKVRKAAQYTEVETKVNLLLKKKP